MSKLRVMLIDESQERSAAVAGLLQSVDCEVVACLSPEQDLLSQVARYRPDVVIIDIDLPSRDTLESLRSVQAADPRPMVMFSQDDDGDTIRRAVQAGVSAYVVDGLRKDRVRPIIDVTISRFHAFQRLQEELTQAKEALEARKVIERAKGILMKQKGMTEEEAYHLLRRTAMRQKRKLFDIAQSVVTAAQMFEQA